LSYDGKDYDQTCIGIILLCKQVPHFSAI